MSCPPESSFDYSLLLDQLGAARLRFNLEHIPECTSSNTEMLLRAAQGAPSGSALVCDLQTGGRGRRGRQWLSSPGFSLCFSLLWRLPEQTSISGLSLAVGLAIAQALETLGATDISLKWPNDIWLKGRKLGGILIEVAGSPQHLVIGIGLNLKRDPHWQTAIEQGFAGLDETLPLIRRETLLAAILQQLAALLDEFALRGFSGMCEAWESRHALAGQPVRISGEHETIEGICGKARADGSLEIQTSTGLRLIHTGDLSLRPHGVPCTS